MERIDMTKRIETVGQLKIFLNNYYNTVPVETRNRHDIGVEVVMDTKNNKVEKLIFKDSEGY
jgi:hypothetical protein